MAVHRHPLRCIVPPILLERIARNGTEPQRRWALDTMSRDQSFRAARAQNVTMRRAMGLDALGAGRGGAPTRTIYDAKNTEDLRGAVVARDEGGPAVGDAASDEAYDGLGDTYRFLWEAFDRNSIDDQGFRLDGVVHFGDRYDNAFWDGRRMVFGDGDGDLFNRFTASLDVIGHELGHGVTEDEAGLIYWQQPGALNDTMSDNGGVHINSGIPNHAFYLAATSLGGRSWERAGRIWYETLRDPRVKPTASFRGFARATGRTAERLFGGGSDEAVAVWEAWDEVGIRLRWRARD